MKRSTLALLAVATAGSMWMFGGSPDSAESTATSHLANRIWVERMPEHGRDMVWHMVAVDHERGRFGAFGRSSKWRHFAEVFKWRLRGDKLHLNLPQQRRKVALPARTWDCKGEAPAPFELCLQLGRGDKAHVFYSKRRWKVRPHDEGFVFEDEADVPEAIVSALEVGIVGEEDEEAGDGDEDGEEVESIDVLLVDGVVGGE